MLKQALDWQDYPFGGEEVFDEEKRLSIQHKNAKRIAFVKAQIKELENDPATTR
jgi:hypothetical protein